MARGQRSEVGDERWSPNGYHYTRTEDGWELTHKLIAEKTLGRKLADNERCRFIDGDRTNLDPSNIAVYVTTTSSKRRRLARLIARRDELNAEIAALEAEIADG
jgi:hypothetical protein